MANVVTNRVLPDRVGTTAITKAVITATATTTSRRRIRPLPTAGSRCRK